MNSNYRIVAGNFFLELDGACLKYDIESSQIVSTILLFTHGTAVFFAR